MNYSYDILRLNLAGFNFPVYGFGFDEFYKIEEGRDKKSHFYKITICKDGKETVKKVYEKP